MTQLADFAANQPKRVLSVAPDTSEQAETPDTEGLDLHALIREIARLKGREKSLTARAEDAERGWKESLLSRGYRGPEERNTHDVLVSLANLAEETLAVQRKILNRLDKAGESRSSVEYDSNGSAGKAKVKIKEYVDQPVDEALDSVKEKFAQAMAEVEAGSTHGWAEMVEMLAAKKGGEA